MHGHTVSTGVTTANWQERTERGRPDRHGSEFETKYIVTLYSHRGSTQNLDGLAAQYLGLVRYGSMVLMPNRDLNVINVGVTLLFPSGMQPSFFGPGANWPQQLSSN